MARLPEGISRFGDRIILAVCVLLSLWAASLGESSRIAVGTRIAHRLLTPVERSMSFLNELSSLKAENEELRRRVVALKLDFGQLENERRYIEELRERGGFYQKNRGRLAPAVVLELVSPRIPIQAKIECMGGDSLRVLQPVLTERGLVGRVSEVLGGDTALVELLTNDDARISIESVASGVTGILRYDGRTFFMDYVPQGDPVGVGDPVITSGLGGTVPRGIPVGTIARVQPSEVELFQRIEVKPAIHFSALSQVYVVTRDGPWYSRKSDMILPDEGNLLQEKKP